MRKRIKKLADRITAAVLMLVLCFNLGAGSYQQVQAASLAAYGSYEILQGIFALFGFFAIGNELVNHADDPAWWTDGSAALDPYANGLYGNLEEEYNKERFRVINGGGGNDPQPSPTPKPEATPEPVPTPSPGDVPTFSELVAPAAAGTGLIAWTQGAWECMAAAVSNIWDNIMHRFDFDPSQDDFPISDKVLEVMASHPGYSYYFLSYTELYGGRYTLYLSNKGFIVPSDSYMCMSSGITLSFGGIYEDIESGFNNIAGGTGKNYTANLPVFATIEEGKNHLKSQSINKEEIWVHPDLQDTYQNNGKLEYPQQAPQPLNIPTIEQLQELARKLNPEINPNYTPEMAPNYVQELIEQLKRDPSVDPDPDPGTNPDPNPGVDPKPTGVPKPTPEPTPEPDNPDEDNGKYLAPDLKDYFPFCIPFDLYDIFKNFSSARAAPKFTFHLKSEKFGFDYPVEIDLSSFDQAAEILRTLELILFVVLLAVASRKLIGAGG